MRIEAERVSVVIDGHRILHEESVTCAPGTMTALVGASGSGKTTLLHCLGLLQRPSSGRVLLGGSDVTGWRSGRIRRFWRDHAAFVLQDYGIMESDSVSANVAMAPRLLGNRRRRDPRLDAALGLTGLAGRNDEVAAHLSGGEKQRLSVARAIYKQAQVILVDEPTASLDGPNRDRVIALFADRAADGCTVIVATHDPAFIDACDHRHQVGERRTLATA